MRNIYLVRHGETEPGMRKGRCICRTDIPLSAEGVRQAEALGVWLASRSVSRIFASPLSRCPETAWIMAREAEFACGGKQAPKPEAACASLVIEAVEELSEIAGGLWEGMLFSEIRERFPETYEARGKALGTVAPPGGESFLEGGIRLYRAIRRLLGGTGRSEGDLVLVTHSGVIRGLLCLMFGWDPARIMDIPVPCGSVTRLWTEGEGELLGRIEEAGVRPGRYPGREACLRLWDRYDLPDHIRAHEEAVAELACGWAGKLCEKGQPLDAELTYEAALLHHIARLGPDHARAGAKLLREEGYPELSHIVRVHHGMAGGEEYRLTEASLVFLADKYMQGDKRVSLEERFEKSRAKCRTPEGMENHQKQYRQAAAIKRNLEYILGENT